MRVQLLCHALDDLVIEVGNWLLKKVISLPAKWLNKKALPKRVLYERIL
jgi:hypothetical protein